MSLATLKEVLQPAWAGGYALPGFVVLGYEEARAYVEAGEITQTPIILQAGPSCRAYYPMSMLGSMFRALAESATVPVVCHIDHATCIEECQQGLDDGFNSIMFDGSHLQIDENIEKTRQVVELSRRYGASVEGEVGIVGYQNAEASQMSDPIEAKRLWQEAGLDALAISIGNVHLNDQNYNRIDFSALKAIEANVETPLVLHGGSGISPEDQKKLATQTKICKINIGTCFRQSFTRTVRTVLAEDAQIYDRIAIMKHTISPLRDLAVQTIYRLHP